MRVPTPTPEQQERHDNRLVLDAVAGCRKIIKKAVDARSSGSEYVILMPVLARLLAEMLRPRKKLHMNDRPVQFSIGSHVQALMDFDELDEIMLAACTAKNMRGELLLEGSGWLDAIQRQATQIWGGRHREEDDAEDDFG
jgi:hypothetical protein